jgi:hypothetical protein
MRSNFVLSALLCATTLVSINSDAIAESEIAKKAIAKADALAAKLLDSCDADLKKFCGQVTPGDGRLVFCMMAHEDKISDQCFGAMFDAADRIELVVSDLKRAADLCDRDIEKLCGTVDLGEGRIAQCLIDNKAKVSADCGAEVADIEARLKH